MIEYLVHTCMLMGCVVVIGYGSYWISDFIKWRNKLRTCEEDCIVIHIDNGMWNDDFRMAYIRMLHKTGINLITVLGFEEWTKIGDDIDGICMRQQLIARHWGLTK